MNGVIIVNKEKNKTSRDVINELNHIFKEKKMGHTGTLDPIATGVLVVCIGSYTKLVEELTSLDKEYIATVKLGIQTDTLDITGNITEKKDFSFTKDYLEETLYSFIGKYNMEVPIYSAVKINGKKLYEYARENKKIDLPIREVEIYDIKLLDYKNDEFTFKVKVSKGTYIRTLIKDICKKLNTVGCMKELKRTKQGKFNIEASYSLEEIKNNNYKLLELEEVLNYKVVNMDSILEFKIKNGVALENIYNEDKIIFKSENICAIYKNEKGILKMDKMLKN